MRRLRKIGSRYGWEPLPSFYSIRQIPWIVDTLVSPMQLAESLEEIRNMIHKLNTFPPGTEQEGKATYSRKLIDTMMTLLNDRDELP